ncbi:MAG: endonuclease III domain-containing protein [Candidatus Binatus sp.]|jgi:endonuclease III
MNSKFPRAETKLSRVNQRGPHDVGEISRLLARQYKNFDHYNRKNPLDELLFILCSTKTSELGYRETFRALRRRFPSNGMLAAAKIPEISAAIARGGLAKKKACAIKAIMQKTTAQFGKPTLAPLRRMSDAECERLLTSLPGVGKKVARCVMMYSLGRRTFPVDVHCWRIAHRLGWVRQTRRNRSGSPRDDNRLQQKIPPNLRFSLHVNFVSLGRDICTARDPKCGVCPIAHVCRRVGVKANRPAREMRQ